MSQRDILDDLSERLSRVLPGNLGALHSDVRDSFRGVLQGAFERMELISREEFDVQRDVLARTRARIEELEARVAELEAQAAKPARRSSSGSGKSGGRSRGQSGTRSRSSGSASGRGSGKSKS